MRLSRALPPVCRAGRNGWQAARPQGVVLAER
jgi:hypothetical protein